MSPNRRLFVVLVSNAFLAHFAVSAQSITHEQGEIAGEATQDSVILQSRLTMGSYPFNGDVPGASGIARFEIATSPDFSESTHTEWIRASVDNDFIVKTKVRGLQPNTRYYYRLEFGPDTNSAELGAARTFKTLAGADSANEVSFVVVTGLNYINFQNRYTGSDKSQG